jgi:hypoxia up-regulated 1
MRSIFLRLSFTLLVVFIFSFEAAFASVLAIDYGADWIKASLMKPGVPFDILLNKDSKRKIQSSVGWKKSDRLFGSDAYNIVSHIFTVFVQVLVELCFCRPAVFHWIHSRR